MNSHFEALGFNTILEALKEYALSEKAKQTFDRLTPFLQEDICVRKLAETTAARNLLDACGSPPVSSMNGLEELLILAENGAMLMPDQLTGMVRFTASCKRMTAYLSKGEAVDQTIAVYGRSLSDLDELQQEIEHCVYEDKLHDEASTELRNIRRKMEHIETQIKEKLSHILQSRKQYLADGYITNRNGHYVLPVQRRFQNQFGGRVIEVSGKGSTVFMEPTSVAKQQAELEEAAIEEDGEIRRILYTLSALVADHAAAVRHNMEAMEVLDVLFAKAKLSASMNARAVAIGGERRLHIRQAKHPLLPRDQCVPLDFDLDEKTSGVIITGPNTGGKTVAVKTVGLLSLMAQCGLHIPCEEGSYIAMQDGYWCDIGDSQNISQNLSTFSGHITNVIGILEQASPDSLVLLDELGSGTDPAEGMGIAIAVLEELRKRGCMFLVTTHYAQVKKYAEETEKVQSARMAFDRQTLQPLYQLEMGKSGESCALHIARRLGLAPHLLERAHREVYGGTEQPKDHPVQTMPVPKSRLMRAVPAKQTKDVSAKFTMGDSVAILPEQETGIVYLPADENGDVVVQVKGKKRKIRHNRLQLQVAASELYPPDYDFSIIFDTVENRKARHQMDKRHDPNLLIRYEES